jgi:hypothetical protein
VASGGCVTEHDPPATLALHNGHVEARFQASP